MRTTIATGADDRERLRHEADRLRRARHPGVVEIVAFDDGEPSSLSLAVVGPRSLRLDHPRSVGAVAAVMAALATTVADLHDLGIAHGHLTSDHIHLDLQGRPVLSGFGPDDDPPGGRHGDVIALGQVLLELLDDPDLDHPPSRPRHRPIGRPRWRPSADPSALRTLAVETQRAEPANRPSARSFAAVVVRSAPPPSPATTGRQTSRRRHRRGIVGAAIGLAVPVIALAALSLHPGPRPTLDDGSRLEPDPLLAAGPWSLPSPEPESPPPGDPLEVSPTAGSVPGPIGQTIVTTDGLVERDGVRYAIGDPGDEVAVGDFACNGEPLAAVLRPGSGQVFVFTRWADANQEAVASLALVLPPDSHWRASDLDDRGCARLLARLADGRDVTVPWPRPPSPGSDTDATLPVDPTSPPAPTRAAGPAEPKDEP